MTVRIVIFFKNNSYAEKCTDSEYNQDSFPTTIPSSDWWDTVIFMGYFNGGMYDHPISSYVSILEQGYHYSEY